MMRLAGLAFRRWSRLNSNVRRRKDKPRLVRGYDQGPMKLPTNMIALIVKHRTAPGKREAVVKVWLHHMAPAVDNNEEHLAYFYCEDPSDPDAIVAFQQYRTAQAAQDFLRTPAYLAYLQEVEPLLSGPPQVVTLRPVWVKHPQS
jgi:quinol monooxygenase YgiN